RLGFVTFPDSQTDCRRLWPPLGDGGGACECTVCVAPNSHPTLQEAVDQIKTTGGTICLEPGVYDLGDGVNVTGARSLRIRGHGPATILVARDNARTLQQSVGVTVENLAAISGSAAPAAIEIRIAAGAAGRSLAPGAVGAGASLDAVGSKIATGGAGIVVGADATVASTVVNHTSPGASGTGTDGIVVAQGGIGVAPGHVRITGNR